jgi:hypothetical protein
MILSNPELSKVINVKYNSIAADFAFILPQELLSSCEFLLTLK